MKYALNLTLIIFCLGSNQAIAKQYPPFDHAKQLPGFVEFRAKLIQAVKRRDTKYVMSIMDEKIHLSFGGFSGLKDFKKLWQPDKPNSKFWHEMSEVLRLGGCADKDEKSFTAPYIFCLKLPNSAPFSDGIVVGTNVRMREQPALNSPVIKKLSWHHVSVNDWNKIPGKNGSKLSWYKVTLPTQKTGYIASQFVRSVVSYRAKFELKNGQWRMVFFISGD